VNLGTWATTDHDARAPEGERCRCGECAPPPTTTLYEARRSPERQRERDLQIARWRRLAPDEVPPYLRYLALYDLRTEERELREATEAVVCARLDADLAAFWLAHGEPRARAAAQSLAPPRIYAPRIAAPGL